MSGRTVIVTGGGGGLGSAICEEFARLGDAVAVWDFDREAAQAVAERVGGRAYALDVADSAAGDEATAAVGRDLGPVGVLVNCAGVSNVGDHTHELSDEIWHESIAVMQTAVFFCSRAAGRVMLERGSGAIVNISSIRGFSPNP